MFKGCMSKEAIQNPQIIQNKNKIKERKQGKQKQEMRS